MFLTCYKKECGFFRSIEQPISHGIKERLSYSPQPRVTRFQPYGEIKEIFEKHRQEAKQKAFIQHQRYTRKYDEGFEMCDNGFNSLGSPNIFHGLRYREWMHEVWESYKFYVQKMKEDSRDNPDVTLCLEKDDVLCQAYHKYRREAGITPKVTGCWRFCMKDTLKANTYLFNVMLSPLKNVKRLKTINSYLLILERLHKMHADQNVLICLTI